MSELTSHNPTGRFSGLADVYARGRPSYPDAALDYITARCGLEPGSLVIDVGCGTGISSRQFADRGLRVLGVEPNAEMRAKAEAELPATGPAPVYQEGRAEALGLPDGQADAVLAAQAFHWFDAAAALSEFRRVLRPGGWVVLMWNERDESDPFTAAYGEIVRRRTHAAAIEGPRARAGEALLQSDCFVDRRRDVFRNEQVLDEAGLLGRALSLSYAPRDPAQRDTFVREVRDLFSRWQREGQVVMRYETSVYTGRRPPADEGPGPA